MSAMLAGRKYVGPRGPSTARIMVVGEAPGANEERLGQPFVGASGELLEAMLASTGSNPSEVFFTNLARYRPPNNELSAWFSKEGVPNEIVLAGLEELQSEIELVKPNIIVPLGNFPNALLTGNGRWDKKNHAFTGISDYRGYLVEGAAITGGRKCLPTYHPANVLREYSNKPVAKFDLRRAAIESGHPELRRPPKFVFLDPRGDERRAWVQWLVSEPGTLSPPFVWNRHLGDGTRQGPIRLPSDPFLSADIEYPGNKLVCCGLTRHADIGITLSIYNEVDKRELSDILQRPISQCWQNGMFDASILHWHYLIDCYPNIKHDTFLMMHTVYTEMPRDLGFIASFNDNPPPWWQHINSDWWKKLGQGLVPFSDLLLYNAYDTSQTHEAALRLLSEEITPESVWHNTYHFEMSLVYPLYKISRRGVRIDTAALETLKTTLTEEVKDLNFGLALLNDNRVVKVRSGPQVEELLLKRLQIPPYLFPKTPASTAAKPKYSFDDKALAEAQLKCQNDIQRQAIRLIRETRERANLISKFCDIDLDDDGRMRCHYDPGKTQTRRLASRTFYPTGRGTNLQNVPKDDRVRSVFIPDDGYVFGYADLKSAESLVVAHLSGDPEMLRLHSPEFMSGGRDGHKFVAAFLFNKSIDSITPEERYIGKRTRHACNYMLGWMKLMQYINADADTTGVSINAAAAKEIVRKYRQFHPLLVQWWGEVERELGENNGRLYDCFGNPHQFYGRKDEILPNAVAFKPQGTVGTGLNQGLLRVDASEKLASLDFQILLQVHDAVGFQVPTKNARESIPELISCLTIDTPIKRRGVEDYVIQIPVDVKLGGNWGEFNPKKPTENPKGLRDWETWLKEAA